VSKTRDYHLRNAQVLLRRDDLQGFTTFKHRTARGLTAVVQRAMNKCLSDGVTTAGVVSCIEDVTDSYGWGLTRTRDALNAANVRQYNGSNDDAVIQIAPIVVPGDKITLCPAWLYGKEDMPIHELQRLERQFEDLKQQLEPKLEFSK
jgi:hypothetical protein